MHSLSRYIASVFHVFTNEERCKLVASLSQKQRETLDSVDKSVCLLEMDRCDSLSPVDDRAQKRS